MFAYRSPVITLNVMRESTRCKGIGSLALTTCPFWSIVIAVPPYLFFICPTMRNIIREMFPALFSVDVRFLKSSKVCTARRVAKLRVPALPGLPTRKICRVPEVTEKSILPRPVLLFMLSYAFLPATLPFSSKAIAYSL